MRPNNNNNCADLSWLISEIRVLLKAKGADALFNDRSFIRTTTINILVKLYVSVTQRNETTYRPIVNA